MNISQRKKIFLFPPFFCFSLYYSTSTRNLKTSVRYWWNFSKQQNWERIFWIFQPTSTVLGAYFWSLGENKRSELCFLTYWCLKLFVWMMNPRWFPFEERWSEIVLTIFHPASDLGLFPKFYNRQNFLW